MTCVTFFSTVAKLKELQKWDCTHMKENCQGFKLVYISFILRVKKILKPPFDPKCPNTFDKGSSAFNMALCPVQTMGMQLRPLHSQ